MNQRDELEQLSRSLAATLDIDLSDLPVDVDDPKVPVFLSDRERRRSIWAISLPLTDCYGRINLDQREKTPLRALLEVNGAFSATLYERLLEQMWGDSTSIVRKSGVFGILYEAEFDADEQSGPTTSEVMEKLLAALPRLRKRFPRVEFAVPSQEYWATGMPTVWAFAPNGATTPDSRDALAFAIDRAYEGDDAQWKELWCDIHVKSDAAMIEWGIEDGDYKLRVTIQSSWVDIKDTFGRLETFCKSTSRWKEIVSMPARSMRTKITRSEVRSNDQLQLLFLQDRDELIRRARSLFQ